MKTEAKLKAMCHNFKNLCDFSNFYREKVRKSTEQ